MADRFAEAAAFGIHRKTVATWDAALYRDLRLLVPIHVDALAVRAVGGSWADCRMRTPEEGGSRRSIDLLPPPFSEREPRERGIHLHWAMPDGLVVLEGAESPQLQALPDRWLVARVAPGNGGRNAVRAWVLDARNASARPLDTWSAGAPVGPVVTALGIGDAGWSGYADNVVNRFAFLDPLVDVAAGPVSYLVCGWYAVAGEDPLARGTATVHAFEQRLAELRWELPEGSLPKGQTIVNDRIERAARAGLDTPHAVRRADGAVLTELRAVPIRGEGSPLGGKYVVQDVNWPRATLLHGGVVGIPWPTLSATSPEIGGPPSASRIAVSIAPTPAEALAALVGSVGGHAADAEWLTAFAVGGLDELNAPDGDARLDDRLHDAAFASRPDGSTKVTRQPRVLDRPPPKPPVGGKHGVVGIKATMKDRWTMSKGSFLDVHETVTGTPRPPITEPTEIDLPNPRLYLPSDPCIAIQGCQRSPKHGGDGRFSPNGRLMCRVSGTALSALSLRVTANGVRGVVYGRDVLDRPLLHGGVPPECEELLEELALLDPGSTASLARVVARQAPRAGALDANAILRIAQTEQSAVFRRRDPGLDERAVVTHGGFEGYLPSPLGIRPATRPWVPLHLDWEVEYYATAPEAWTAGEIDFEPGEVPAASQRFSGRSLLSPGLASSLAAAVRTYVANEEAAGTNSLANADDIDALEDAATRLQSLDMLSGVFEHLHLKLRRDVEPDAPAGTVAPPGFVPVRSGFLRVRRLRLVDAFGQTLDLAGSGASTEADPGRIVVGSSLTAGSGTLPLPPRFTAPAKISFRFRDAGHDADATEERSPVCGWLLADHLDDAIEVCDGDGSALGQLRLDDVSGTVWEPAPGTPTPVGANPRDAIGHAELAGLVQSLFEAGARDKRESRAPLHTEVLRIIDSTRWTVDPFAHAGEEHLSLLVGHPIAVVAASLRIEVREPVTGTALDTTRVPVRLGALTHWEDGLFGFFVNRDFTSFKVARASALLARPRPRDGFLGRITDVPAYAATFADDVGSAAGDFAVDHPEIDRSGVMWVVPGITYELLLLVEPHCAVHATSCLLPRKSIAVLREWMAPALARIAPTFRFGPVLRDPQKIRMPIPADIGGAWTWTHRADVDRWAEEEVVHAGHEALLPPDPAVATEGWLKLTPESAGGERVP